MDGMTASPFEYRVDQRRHIGALFDSTAAPMAAVVLLPDWRGQSALARDHARHLVELGCAVVVADLYGDGFNPDSPEQVGPMVQRLIAQRTEGVAALDACIARIRDLLPSGTPVVCLGYSAGGMVALDHGRSGKEAVAGIILCTALLKTAAPGMETRITAPVLILQGTQDQVSPMDVIDAVIAEMDAAGNDVRFQLFSQTHHAFDNPDAGTDPTARLVYSPASARHARHAIASFLDEVGKSPSGHP